MDIEKLSDIDLVAVHMAFKTIEWPWTFRPSKPMRAHIMLTRREIFRELSERAKTNSDIPKSLI